MIQVYDKYGKIKSSGLPGTGTVTSFSAGNLSPLFNSVVTSPTSTPNISFSKISQAQNLFYASPNGSSGVPTFRALVAADIPTLTGYVPTSRTLTINGITYDLSADRTWTISSATNLGYTPSPTNGIVTSDTGTDATIPLADGTNAGLLTPAEKTIIAGSQAYADAKVADAIVDGVTTVAPSQNVVFDALALKVNSSTATTGSVITFDTAKIFNTFTTPTTADITNDLTNAKIGVVQKIYSNKAVEPTYPLGWVKIGGDYTVSVVNIIYAEWSEGSRVEYWIIKG